MTAEATVFLVDDDESLGEALVWLLESVDLKVESYGSADELLDSFDPSRPGCLVVDIRMPGMSGLELQKKLRDTGVATPVIFITGHGDVPMCVQAFQQGAFSFLEKPINHQKLLDEIHRAMAHDLELRERSSSMSVKLEKLSPREREVMDLIAAGSSMKQIAVKLGISIQTCSKHRARVLEKLEVTNNVELVRLLLASESH
jgi:two-component system response regulator FixJ